VTIADWFVLLFEWTGIGCAAFAVLGSIAAPHMSPESDRWNISVVVFWYVSGAGFYGIARALEAGLF
jgi:hypothetical protein